MSSLVDILGEFDGERSISAPDLNKIIERIADDFFLFSGGTALSKPQLDDDGGPFVLRSLNKELNPTSGKEGFGPNAFIITKLDARPPKNLNIYKIGAQDVVDDAIVVLVGDSVNGAIGVGRDGARLVFSSNTTVRVDIRAWRNATLIVDRFSTINQAKIIMDNVPIWIGRDSMLSDEILLQAGDQHTIWNVDELTVLNDGRQAIVIGEHVWLGRRSTILAGAAIGDGSIVAAATLVTGVIDPFTLVAGVPARKLKDRVSWSRNIGKFSAIENEFLNRHDVSITRKDM